MALHIAGDISTIINLASGLQKHGTQKNIVSVFDDGGCRELLLATLFNLKLHSGRHGDDAFDEVSNRFELKTVNLVDTSGKLRKKPGITTCHHVNRDIIERYRKVHAWLIGVFFVNEPVEIYEVPTKPLLQFFDTWEKRLINEGITHINNPKIPFNLIREFGELKYINKSLSEKYIDGDIKQGTEVFKDVMTFDRTKIIVSDDKLKAIIET